MMLGDRDLQNAITQGELIVDPLGPDYLQPASIDLRLDRHFRAFHENPNWPNAAEPIDPAEDSEDRTYAVEASEDKPYMLWPHQFVLGSTFEVVSLSEALAARLEGKSSLGRLGLMVHSTAGFIDPGFTGHVTLELANVNTAPILLWPGMKIGQLAVFRLQNPALNGYGSRAAGSHYQGQRGPTVSRSHINFDTIPTDRRDEA